MPMPWSVMVRLLVASSVVMLICSGLSAWKTSFSVSCVRRIFSRESAALETSSRMKISRSVYREWITMSRTCFTSAWNSCVWAAGVGVVLMGCVRGGG